MTDREEVTASVLAAFKARGFRYVGRNAEKEWVVTGPLVTTEGRYQCNISIPPNFDRPPSIDLVTVPDALKPIAPHIDSSGGICYLSRHSISLNIFDPVGQMLGCFERAEKVLGQLLRNELVEDLAEEFFAYWGTDDSHCYFDFRVGTTRKLQTMVDLRFMPRVVLVFVTDDVSRTVVKSKAMGFELNPVLCTVEKIYTKIDPRPLQHQWPPKNLGELVQWQAVQDSKTSRRIVERVAQAAEKGEGFVTVLIETPKFFYSFFVLLRPTASAARPTKVELRRKSVLYSSAVFPLRSWRIDESYIIQRNIPGMKTLENKKIIVVGCGTIGGYLADMLVKAGAGAGDGELVLIDPDRLSPGNLGRHRLGFPYLEQKKAIATRDELVRNMPDATIKALAVDVKEANLAKAALIIDATGEQTVSDYLASAHSHVPQLNVWIEGPGVAVRALIRREEGEACVQCLTRLLRKGEYSSTVEDMPKVYAGQGCESEYVPFPASVSIQAACLAFDMVMDWSAGVATPALQTRVLNQEFTKKQADCDVPRQSECPACST